MVAIYEEKIQKKEDEILAFNNLKGKDLFDSFTLEEKINAIHIGKNLNKRGLKSLSTNFNSID